jgi:hypothetical protein
VSSRKVSDKLAYERKATVTYTGDGSQKIFAFPFDYLSYPFVKVRIDEDVLVYGTDYGVNGKQVELLTAPAVDAVVTVYRETSTERMVAWENASVMTAGDMTLEQVQQLHLAEETMDKVQDSGLALDPLDSRWDARFGILKNLLDPENPGDAVPLRYLESVQGAVVTAKNTAVQKASEAATSASAALVSEGKARTSEINASASETAAEVAETAAVAAKVEAVSAKDTVVPLVPTVNQAAQDAAAAAALAAQAAQDAAAALEGVKALGAVPVGMLVPFLVENVPPGYLLLSGVNRVASFDQLLYPDLYAYLGTDQLPDCTNKFPEGAGDRIAGGAVKAWRLPTFETNITGSHGHNGTTQLLKYTAAGGSLTVTAGTLITTEWPSLAGDHSHSLSIPAGNTDTYLAPDAFGVYWAIKAFGALSNEGTAEAAQLIADVAVLKTQEAWQTPTFLNGWTQFDSVGHPVRYYKDSTGIVHLKGLVKGGATSTEIFKLPSGYRPSSPLLIFTTMADNAFAAVQVSSGGNVTHRLGGVSYVTLDGISFRAEG